MSKSSLRTEKYPLPGTIDGILGQLREILAGGSVKRIELDTEDKNLRVRRWVEADDLAEEDITWEGAVRNVPVLDEYDSPGASSFQVVVDMLLMAQSEKVTGVTWITGMNDTELLRRWLEVDRRSLQIGEVQELLGLPLRRIKSITEETLILCCASNLSSEPEETVYAIKTAMELEREDVRRNEDVGRGRHDPQERDRASVPLLLNPAGLRSVPWNDPSGHE